MDASRTLIAKNNKGAVFVVTAIFLMLVVSAILLIAVDFSFMYVNKSKLQNAADAGALAGAGRLNKQPLGNFTGARKGSEYFASENFRLIDQDPNTRLTLDKNPNNLPDGDIVLGIWDPTASTKFTPRPAYTPFSTANAVRVTARRTGQTGTGIGTNSTVPLFFGKFFGNIFSFSNTSTMGAKASAIAYRPPRARTYILISKAVCDATVLPVKITPSVPIQNMAWTDLEIDGNHNTTSNEVRTELFCPGIPPFKEVCGSSLYTNNGIISSIFKSVEVDFYDPNYDPGMKTFAYDSHGNRYVYSWDVIVPVTLAPNPTTPGTAYPVWGYAEVTLSRACGSGGGNPCQSSSGRDASAPNPNWVPTESQCNGDEIVIASIRCTSCANRWSLMGAKPILAQ